MAKNKQWQDPNGKHLRLYHSLLNSPAFVALKPSSKVLFFRMRMDLGATNNGDISATLSTLKHHGIKSAATYGRRIEYRHIEVSEVRLSNVW